MTSAILPVVRTAVRGERMSIPLTAATMVTVLIGSALTLVQTSVPEQLGVSNIYAIIAGMVLMATALLGAFNNRLAFVIGGYAVNLGLLGAIGFGRLEFQDGATFAMSYVTFGVVMALVAGLIKLDAGRAA